MQARFIAVLSTILLLLAGNAASLAQATRHPAPGNGQTREGDIYDFRKHQPAQPPPSSQNRQEVDDEVKALLKQTDELDRQFGGSANPGAR